MLHAGQSGHCGAGGLGEGVSGAICLQLGCRKDPVSGSDSQGLVEPALLRGFARLAPMGKKQNDLCREHRSQAMNRF